MGKYLMTYRGGTMAETEEQRQEEMAAWGRWFEEIGDRVVDGGNPIGASASVGDGGSVSEGAPSGLSGYSLFSAGSLEEAAALAKGCPILRHGGSVDVYETIDMS